MDSQQVKRQYTTPAYSGRRGLDFSPFEQDLAGLGEARRLELDAWLLEASIPSIQLRLEQGQFTGRELAVYYLERIRRLDVNKLNAVDELNPEAIEIASRLDEERRVGQLRGPLHGIPVLIKDNIATGDWMHTTAGAKAMESARADRDAFLVQRLRAAGAVLLGKANLSEWANFLTKGSANGFSLLGGQVRNPYGRFDVSGSSSGSAVAVAANLIPAAVGTETCGSLISPASHNSIVSLKPSLGLISRDRIIPISSQMDTAGPMTRSLTDLCILMNALAGADPNDPLTVQSQPPGGADWTAFLDPGSLQGMRVAFISARRLSGSDLSTAEKVKAALRQCGAAVVELRPRRVFDWSDFYDVLCYGMKHDLKRYLDGVGDFAPVASLEEIIAFNQQDLPNRAPFGQSLFERAQANQLTAEEHAALAGKLRDRTQAELRRLLAESQADLLCSLEARLAGYYAPAGFPALTLPAGYRPHRAPVGVTFVGDLLQDGKLIAAASALERVPQARRQPAL